ncbi:MAG: monovalent cation/H(+) antiporter subunit G [Actinomycetota bacterium]|nr:monovalent cation/H(+) antiporter subunit G [Actinomycetota bacterium]
MREILAAVLLLAGVTIGVVGGVGLHRFGSVYARMHAATKPATLGLGLVLAGAAVRVGDSGDVVKLVLVIVFQFLTAPLAAHALARSAYRAGIPMGSTAELDELDDAGREGGEAERR